MLERMTQAIEAFSEYSGRATSWLVLAIVLLICFDVMMRYLFHSGSVALQELEWHLFALLFLFSAAYTLKHDEHVRVDLFYSSRWMNDVRRAWVDLLGNLFFLLPFCILIIYSSWPFVYNAWQFSETSPDPGGLPYRYLLKAAIPIAFLMLALQGVAHILRCLQIISVQSEPVKPKRQN